VQQLEFLKTKNGGGTSARRGGVADHCSSRFKPGLPFTSLTVAGLSAKMMHGRGDGCGINTGCPFDKCTATDCKDMGEGLKIKGKTQESKYQHHNRPLFKMPFSYFAVVISSLHRDKEGNLKGG
jgi:hypothetical protein